MADLIVSQRQLFQKVKFSLSGICKLTANYFLKMERKKTNNKILFSLFFPYLKLENEDFSTVDHPLEGSLAIAGQDIVNELTLSMQKVLEEPINLSIKKSQRCSSPCELLSNTSFLPMNATMRQHGSKEGIRLFSISIKVLVCLSHHCPLQALQSSMLINVLWINVLFQEVSNIIRVLSPMEKCV